MVYEIGNFQEDISSYDIWMSTEPNYCIIDFNEFVKKLEK